MDISRQKFICFGSNRKGSKFQIRQKKTTELFFNDTFLFVWVWPVRIRIRLGNSTSVFATGDRSAVVTRPRQADFLTRCWRGQSSQSSWSCPSAPSCRPQNSPRHPGPPVRVGLFSHYWPVLRIRNYFFWSRIRILDPKSWIADPDSGSLIFTLLTIVADPYLFLLDPDLGEPGFRVAYFHTQWPLLRIRNYFFWIRIRILDP